MSGCRRHKHCAYSGTEPGLCSFCHASTAKCAGRHGGRPVDGWGEHTRRGVRMLVAAGDTATLRAGQHYDPGKQADASTPAPQGPQHPSQQGEKTAAA